MKHVPVFSLSVSRGQLTDIVRRQASLAHLLLLVRVNTGSQYLLDRLLPEEERWWRSPLTQSPTTSHTIASLSASWEPDLWGLVRRTVEASSAWVQESMAAQALRCQHSSIYRKASLAQFYYFELQCGLDTDQQILDQTVTDYQNALKLTQNRYQSGVAAQTDVIQARTQLESAKAQAINNHIGRAQFEHAIAVLIGQPPEMFSLPPHPLHTFPPAIPLSVPSALFETVVLILLLQSA